MFRSCLAVVLLCAVAFAPRAASAQQAATGSDVPELMDPADDPPAAAPAEPARSPVLPPVRSGDRIFGVLPNFGTVEGADRIPPDSIAQKFRMASLNSFDPYLYPFVGFVAAINHPRGSGAGGYGRQYGVSFADNTIGNFMTTAVLPSALHQDPRYYELGKGSVLHRIAYAASRSVITRGDSGARQFNVSELGGNLIAAGLSNAYYAPVDRTLTGTLGRWGMQVMWDTLSNEMKEFWPDIRRRLHRE